MKEKYRYLGKNTVIFAISSFGTKFLSFLLVPFYTNILSTEEYGVADLITTTSTLMIFIFTINIADAVLRFTLERNEKQEEILSYGLRVLGRGTLAVLILLGLVWLSGLINWKRSYYIFILGYFFFTALFQILTNYLRAIDNVRSVAAAGVISSIVMILTSIIFLAFIKIGIDGYLTALIIGPAAGSIYAAVRIKLPIRTYTGVICDRTTRKSMKAYCIPLIFNNIALWVNAFLDKYFVTAMCGIAQNGIYAAASKIPTILSMCYTVFSQAWNLSAIKEFDGEDKDGFFSDTYKVYNSLIICICSALILLNIPLAKFLYAKDFFDAWNYSSVLLISVMFNAMTAFLGSVFSAVKDSKAIASTTLISALVNIVLNAILIPVMGAFGAAVATAVCYAVMWAVRLAAARKYIAMRVSLSKDIAAYGLLIVQVFFEHLEGHFYLGQAAVFFIILIIYKNNITRIAKRFIAH